MKREDVIEKIKEVKDPEIGIDVWTLGLIYDIKINDDGVEITMTLTTPLCPFADGIIKMVEDKVGELFVGDKFKSVKVELSFDPPWKPSPKLCAMLGI